MSTGLTDKATMPDLSVYGAPNVDAVGDAVNIPGPDGIDWEEDRVPESAVA